LRDLVIMKRMGPRHEKEAPEEKWILTRQKYLRPNQLLPNSALAMLGCWLRSS